MNERIPDNDWSSADDSEISSVEDDSNDLSASDSANDDNHSPSGDDLSSSENYGGEISSIGSDRAEPVVVKAQGDKSVTDDITSLRPRNDRPNISVELVRDSTVASKLPGFLAQMRAANQELEKERSAGTLANRRIEIDDDESAAEGDQHIEMNLGLGVLEEKNYGTNTTIESDSSNEEGDGDIIERLLGGKRKHDMEDGKGGPPKKVKIQEV